MIVACYIIICEIVALLLVLIYKGTMLFIELINGDFVDSHIRTKKRKKK